MAASAPSSRPPSKLYDAVISIVSAKHLKNVNWRNGDLSPYVSFWIDAGRRFSTKSDDSGSTRPVWNERFVVPLTLPPEESVLTLEILHSKPSEIAKPLVGTLRIPLRDLADLDDAAKIRNFELRLPSGRPQGKIRLKLGIRERPNPNFSVSPPASSYYFPPAPPPPQFSPDPRGYNLPPYSPHHYSTLPSPAPLPNPHPYPHCGYTDPYPNYYSGYYSHAPYPPRPFSDRQSSYSRPGPSAPVDYAPPYDHTRGGKIGLGSGLAVGAVAGALSGLALEERFKYEEEKIGESGFAARDNFSDYHGDY